MLIGILSDSHGRADTTARAVTLLREAGAEMLLHLGDIGNEAVIDELIDQNARIVFGNCDWDERTLAGYAELVGVAVDHPLGEVEANGKRIVFTHGHLRNLYEQALADAPDYLLHGHTHEVRDERVGSVRIINPGALFRAAEYTAAILDPGRDELRIIGVSGRPEHG
jgi:putative phosphoesterase